MIATLGSLFKIHPGIWLWMLLHPLFYVYFFSSDWADIFTNHPHMQCFQAFMSIIPMHVHDRERNVLHRSPGLMYRCATDGYRSRVASSSYPFFFLSWFRALAYAVVLRPAYTVFFDYSTPDGVKSRLMVCVVTFFIFASTGLPRLQVDVGTAVVVGMYCSVRSSESVKITKCVHVPVFLSTVLKMF